MPWGWGGGCLYSSSFRLLSVSRCLSTPLRAALCVPAPFPLPLLFPLQGIRSCPPPVSSAALLVLPTCIASVLSLHFLFHQKQWFLLCKEEETTSLFCLTSFLPLLIAQLNSQPEGVTGHLQAPLSLLRRDGVTSWCWRPRGGSEGQVTEGSVALF